MSETSSNQSPPASDVFVSYASQDATVANSIVESLERQGLKCWIAPRDVVPGTQYADGIVHAIDESRILVLVVSKEALASAHVGRELERAASKRHPVIALRIDTAPLTAAFEYFLNQSQWIEVSTAGTDGAIAKLTEAVERHLAPGSAAVPAQAPQALVGKATASKRVWGIAGAVVVLALAAASVLVGRLHLKSEATIAVADKSIAVLPFVDMSEKKDQEYFADGITEEVLDRLAKVPGLKVVGRASSFQFKGKNSKPESIGAALGVAYLLEGSVRKEAGRVRVTSQLVVAKTGLQRWSDRFDSEDVDVLGAQDTIAASVARALQITVEANTVPRAAVKSPEILDAYLRGQQLADRSTRESCEAAVAQFQKALALDPTFAPAAIGLLQTYNFIGANNWLPPYVAFERAREAGALAQKLDPHNPIPHVSMAWIHIYYDWDWAAADLELKKAFALGLRDSNGVQAAAYLAGIHRQWHEARQLGIEAVELDPLYAAAHWTLGYQVYLQSGDLAAAEQTFRRALLIAPQFSGAHFGLGLALMLQGQHEPALSEFRKTALDDGQMEGSAMVQFAAGRKAESDAELAKAIRRNGESGPYTIAGVYAFRGENDLAFEWLDRAFKAKDASIIGMAGDPLLRSIKADPRFRAFLKKMNLPEE
jgi:TolB-like protein